MISNSLVLSTHLLLWADTVSNTNIRIIHIFYYDITVLKKVDIDAEYKY